MRCLCQQRPEKVQEVSMSLAMASWIFLLAMVGHFATVMATVVLLSGEQASVRIDLHLAWYAEMSLSPEPMQGGPLSPTLPGA